MSTDVALITADEFAAMSFDRPVELVRGEIVEMTNPGGRHGNICFRLSLKIGAWIETHPEFDAATNDSGILLERNPDTVRGPDLLVIRKSRLPAGQFPKSHLTAPPEVAVEVRSSSDRTSEVLHKVALFLSAGVAEVWVIDPDHRRVIVYRDLEEEIVFDAPQVLTSSGLPGFNCPLDKLFEEA
jgi:Uma2 family endonuclease